MGAFEALIISSHRLCRWYLTFYLFWILIMISKDKLSSINQSAILSERLPPDIDGRTLLQRMKEFPYYGFIDVQPPGSRESFVMFSSNDCAVSSKIFWTGSFSYEPGSIGIWRRLSRDARVVVDCGAYTGLYSLVTAFVNSSALIYAFEPVSFIRARLSMNAIVNGFNNIKVFPCALGDDNHIVELNLPFGPRLFTSGTSITSQKITGTREVAEVRRFDDLDIRSPDLIKIDAEGAEELVFSGMSSSLSNLPFILCEILGKKNPEEILHLLPLGYRYALVMEAGSSVLTEDYDSWRKSGGLNALFYHESKQLMVYPGK
jgi:FkbM family methyltransferase